MKMKNSKIKNYFDVIRFVSVVLCLCTVFALNSFYANAEQGSSVFVEMSFPQESYTLSVGDAVYAAVHYTVTPEDAEVTEPVYSSPNNVVAAIDQNGMITANTPGTVKISASITVNGTKYYCDTEVTVKERYKAIISLSTIAGTTEGLAFGFTPGMNVDATVKDIAASQDISEDLVTVFKETGAMASGRERICTGMIISINGMDYSAVMYGDLNCDSMINEKDTQVLLDFITGKIDLKGARLFAADVLHTGSITVESALEIQRYVFGYIPEL